MKNVMTKNILAAGLISMASSALAIDAADVINRMETRGYTDIETFTTLFGNTLIVGIKDGSKHEFVINKSGVVLRENIRENFKQSFWGSKFFQIFDVDGDGELSEDERKEARKSIRSPRGDRDASRKKED